jgi:hypothetical protein
VWFFNHSLGRSVAPNKALVHPNYEFSHRRQRRRWSDLLALPINQRRRRRRRRRRFGRG